MMKGSIVGLNFLNKKNYKNFLIYKNTIYPKMELTPKDTNLIEQTNKN